MKYNIPTFDEYQRLDEDLKSKLAAGVGGLMMAGALNAANPSDGDPDGSTGPKYNNVEQFVDTLPTNYTSRDLNNYKNTRGKINAYNKYQKYEREHKMNTPAPYYNRDHQKIELASIDYSYYIYKANAEDFFFNWTDNNFTNLTWEGTNDGSASTDFMKRRRSITIDMEKAFKAAYDRYINGTYDVNDANLNFKIVRQGNKAVLLNDPLKIALKTDNLDELMNNLSKYYYLTPVGDSGKNGNDNIFNSKKDNVEWFNISPKPNVKNWKNNKTYIF